MPELVECLASYLYVSDFLDSHPDDSRTLLNLWADATVDEASNAMDDQTRMKDGHVFPLGMDCKFRRGNTNNQTPLWPPLSASAGVESATSSPLAHLELKDVHMTYRALILNLGALWLQISYLTHMSIQIFSRDHWTNSVCAITSKLRGFKVGLALEFEKWFIAFLTLDLVFQPLWVVSRMDLPGAAVDPSIDWYQYLQGVVDWLGRRRKNKNTFRMGLIYDNLRGTEAEQVFPGMGAYSCSEWAYTAGINPFDEEAAIWDNPSRAARVITAYFEYILRAKDEIWNIIRPCIQDGLLAPTKTQRESFATYVYVYGKMQAWTSQRHKNAIANYHSVITRMNDSVKPTTDGSDCRWKRSSVPDLLDCFEPTLLKRALQREGNLSHLVFGKDNFPSLQVNSSQGKDPLTEYFRRKGFLNRPTRLPKFNEETLFLSDLEMRAKWVPTTVAQSSKNIWSVLPPHDPLKSKHGILPRNKKELRYQPAKLSVLSESDQRKLTFRHVIHKANSVVVGPLEYCGNVRVIKKLGGHGKLLSVVRGDPSLPTIYAQRELNHISRVKAGIDKRGNKRQALPPGKRAKILASSATTEVVERPVKRRRLTADQVIALQQL